MSDDKGVGYKKLPAAWAYKPGLPKAPSSGRRKLMPQNLGIKKMCPEDVKRTITRILQMTTEQIIEYETSDDVNVFELAVIASIKRAVETGDFVITNMLLSRIIGRAKDAVEDDKPDPLDALRKIPPAELIRFLRNQPHEDVIDAEAIQR